MALKPQGRTDLKPQGRTDLKPLGQILGGGSDPCAPLGSETLYQDFEHTDPLDACVQGGTLATSLVGSAAIDNTVNNTPGGANSLALGPSNSHLSIPASGLLTPENGWIQLDVRPDGGLASNISFFEYGDASTDYISAVYAQAQSRIYFRYVYGGTWETTYVANPLTIDVWDTLAFKWAYSAPDVTLSISINGGAWINATRTVTPFAAPTEVRIGEQYTGYGSQAWNADNIWMDTNAAAH